MWMPLLGSALVAVGCVRYAHFERPQVEDRTASAVYCWCLQENNPSKGMVSANVWLLLLRQAGPPGHSWRAELEKLPRARARLQRVR